MIVIQVEECLTVWWTTYTQPGWACVTEYVRRPRLTTVIADYLRNAGYKPTVRPDLVVEVEIDGMLHAVVTIAEAKRVVLGSR
jgi:hypothetical protein